MIESRPLPQLTKTAIALLQAQLKTNLDAIGVQTLQALGLNPDDPWTVDFDAGTITREIPDDGCLPIADSKGLGSDS